MMSELCEQYLNESISDPVFALKEGLPLQTNEFSSDLLNKVGSEFEIRPEEDEDEGKYNSAESCFKFEDLERDVNLDLLDFDDEQSGSPFDKYRKVMTNLREDGKIMKRVLKQGVGCNVPDGCVVFIRYRAYLEFKEHPFDSTFMQNNCTQDPAVPYNLGQGRVLVGLHEAILSMKKGEKAEFLIHPDLAYGKLGCPPRVPQEATILFRVEVDRFVDCGDIFSNTDDDLNPEDRLQFSYVYKSAKGYHGIGIELFQKKNYNAAVNKFRQVINMMHNVRLANEEEEKTRNSFLLKNYTNACICYNLLKNYKKVCIMAADAVRVNQSETFKNHKLLYTWGIAKMHLCDFEGAKKHLLAAKKLQPCNAEISEALTKLQKKKDEYKFKEGIMMKKAFGFNEPERPKITEINEAEEAYRPIVEKQLKKFIDNSDSDSLTLIDLNSVDEEKICIKVAQELGLFARAEDGRDSRIVTIKKNP